VVLFASRTLGLPAGLIGLAFGLGPRWAAFAVLLAAEAVSGFGVMLFDINTNSVMAAMTDDGMRSRVAGLSAIPARV
jgi:hypothetical protein